MAKKKSTSAIDDAAQAATTFEESLAEVEKIVVQLESGQLNLADSLRAYEMGVRQLRRCHEQLAHVERRIEVLVGFDAEGRPVTEPLEDESASSLEDKRAARGRRRGAATGSMVNNPGGDEPCDDDLSLDRDAEAPGLF